MKREKFFLRLVIRICLTGKGNNCNRKKVFARLAEIPWSALLEHNPAQPKSFPASHFCSLVELAQTIRVLAGHGQSRRGQQERQPKPGQAALTSGKGWDREQLPDLDTGSRMRRPLPTPWQAIEFHNADSQLDTHRRHRHHLSDICWLLRKHTPLLWVAWHQRIGLLYLTQIDRQTDKQPDRYKRRHLDRWKAERQRDREVDKWTQID
ncbi:hypothetical protein ElyMa_005775900 [Elysia marginata]|uniref:Uncharacterized protein n=1 Tax=Elysia marginata TaxID=1093978 RepID=A0AAV4FT54_9GAST|nr:hypothetical protein ElyMa_005775900 [Elysia marginata]